MSPLWLISISAFWFTMVLLVGELSNRRKRPKVGTPWDEDVRRGWAETERQIALNPGVDYRLNLGRQGVATLVEGIDHSDLPLPIEFHGEIRWITDFGPDWIDLAKPDFGTVHVKTAADSDPQSDASAPELPSRASPPSDGRSYSGGRDAATPDQPFPDIEALEHHAAVLEEFHGVLECTCGPHALHAFDIDPTCPIHGWR